MFQPQKSVKTSKVTKRINTRRRDGFKAITLSGKRTIVSKILTCCDLASSYERAEPTRHLPLSRTTSSVVGYTDNRRFEQIAASPYYAAPTQTATIARRAIRTRGSIIRKSALWVLCRYRHKSHWTKHETRLNRDLGRQRFGDAGYAREELVAELGAAFLCADTGITPEIREDHAAYLGHWLTK
jgi:hypothetical protein